MRRFIDRDLRGRARSLATLDRPEDRFLVGLSLVVLTLLSPELPLPGTLPAIRLEQILLLVVAIPVLRLLVRRPELRRVGLVDAGFAALAVATTVTIVVAPIAVAGATRSLRDGFELVRIAEYWLIYRIGLTMIPADANAARMTRALAVAAISLGLLAALQFISPPGFNDVVTSIWTQGHNLLGVAHEGRAVGTAGNANQFGILAVVLLFAALAGRVSEAGSRSWVWVAAITAATVSVGLAQSRGAILGAVLGLTLAMGLLMARHVLLRGLRLTMPAMAMGAVILIVLVIAAPPASKGIIGRFDLATLLRDPSVVIRLGRVQALLTDPGQGPQPAGGNGPACVASLTPPATPAAGHEPGSSAPGTAATAAADQLAGAVAGFYCDNGAWPSSLAQDLVPTYVAALPSAPTGGAFSLYASQRGYAIGQLGSVDNPAEAPGAGSIPNLLADPSFEQPGSPPAQWLVTPGSTAVAAAGAAFGHVAADVVLPAAGAIYQLVVADLPPATDFTYGVWVKGIAPARLQLYVVAVTAGGQRIDPLATKTVAVTSGGWQHFGVTFRTPPQNLTFLQVMVRAPQVPVHILLDGATVTEGPFALPFGSLQDVAASSILGGGPSFLQSPLIGVGPEKNEIIAAYDNEYVMFLTQYGILGLAAYGFLFATALLVGLRAALRASGPGGLFGVAQAAFTVALAAFAISAGAFHQLQVMVIYWLGIGLTASIASAARRDDHPPQSRTIGQRGASG